MALLRCLIWKALKEGIKQNINITAFHVASEQMCTLPSFALPSFAPLTDHLHDCLSHLINANYVFSNSLDKITKTFFKGIYRTFVLRCRPQI